jgi:hypothetical protein
VKLFLLPFLKKVAKEKQKKLNTFLRTILKTGEHGRKQFLVEGILLLIEQQLPLLHEEGNGSVYKVCCYKQS